MRKQKVLLSIAVILAVVVVATILILPGDPAKKFESGKQEVWEVESLSLELMKQKCEEAIVKSGDEVLDLYISAVDGSANYTDTSGPLITVVALVKKDNTSKEISYQLSYSNMIDLYQAITKENFIKDETIKVRKDYLEKYSGKAWGPGEIPSEAVINVSDFFKNCVFSVTDEGKITITY